jgi:hypothetical protein
MTARVWKTWIRTVEEFVSHRASERDFVLVVADSGLTKGEFLFILQVVKGKPIPRD